MKNKKFVYRLTFLFCLLLIAILVFYCSISYLENNNNDLVLPKTSTSSTNDDLAYTFIYGEVVSKGDSSFVVRTNIENYTKDVKISFDKNEMSDFTQYEDGIEKKVNFSEIENGYYVSIELKEKLKLVDINNNFFHAMNVVIYGEPIQEIKMD